MKQFTITHVLLVVTWLAIGIVIALPNFATQPFSGRIVDLKTLTVQANDYKIDFDSAQIARSPEWHPGSPNPPLSAGRALNIAEKFRMDHLSDLKPHSAFDTRWRLDSIGLHSLDSSTNKWCWVAVFVQSSPTSGFSAQIFTRKIYIDMNGEIFPSTHIPATAIEIPGPNSNSDIPELNNSGSTWTPADGE